jgi:hypothetical protein
VTEPTPEQLTLLDFDFEMPWRDGDEDEDDLYPYSWDSPDEDKLKDCE